MDQILVMVENARAFRMIGDLLDKSYEIIRGQSGESWKEKFDLVLIDGKSLKRWRSQILERRKAEEPVLLPFLFLAQRRKGARPMRYLGALVDDLLVRPFDRDELLARVANLLRMRRLSLQLKREHDLVAKLTVTDDVSGFHNTRYLHRYLDRRIGPNKASEEEISLVFLDLDNFKAVVDTYGHPLGAKVLKEVAHAIHEVLDPDDRIVRYGGDEFVVILPKQDRGQAVVKVERMREAITSTTFLHKEELDVRLTASFGLATFPYDAKDKKELLAEADRCLFNSKRAGKNQVSIPDRAHIPELVETGNMMV